MHTMLVRALPIAFSVAAAGLLLGAAPLTAQLGVKLSHAANGFIEVPYDKGLLPESGITVEAWVTYDPTTLQTGWAWPTLCRMNIQPQLESYFLRVDAAMTATNSMRFKVVTQNGSFGASWSFGATQLMTMTHIAGTYDGAFVKLFVNGVEVASTPGTGRLRDMGGTLRIGKGDDATGNGEVWNGDIDDFRLWPYARTAAEIQSTMSVSLNGVPGGAHTWALDGHTLDTSGLLHGTTQGTVPFVANSLTLTPYPTPGAVAFGGPSSNCAPRIATTVASLARVGNGAFGIVCTNAPASGNGVLALGAQRLPAAFPLLGVDVWVNAGGPLVLANVTSSVLGAARVGVPVPSVPALAAGSVYGQLFWVDAACGARGLTASDGLHVTILP